MENVIEVVVRSYDASGAVTERKWLRQCEDALTAQQIGHQAETSLDVLGLVVEEK